MLPVTMSLFRRHAYARNELCAPQGMRGQAADVPPPSPAPQAERSQMPALAHSPPTLALWRLVPTWRKRRPADEVSDAIQWQALSRPHAPCK